jgi:hypothetical protein
VAFNNLTLPIGILTTFASIPLSNFYDANGDTLSFRVTGLPSWAHFNNESLQFSGKPLQDETVSGVIFIVSDGWGGEANQSFSFIAGRGRQNNPPIVSSNITDYEAIVNQ